MTQHEDLSQANAARWMTLLLRFLLELCLVASFAAVAWSATEGVGRGIAAVAAAVVTMTVWALLLSPKARFPLPAAAAVALEAVLFVAAGVALVAVGSRAWGLALVSLWIVHRVALAVTAKPPHISPNEQ